MKEWLSKFFDFETLLFGQTWIEVVWIALLALLFLAIVYTVNRIVAIGQKGHMEDYFTWVRCDTCGWTGEVSKFHKNCPNCGDTLNFR